jgi:hypothetical protein
LPHMEMLPDPSEMAIPASPNPPMVLFVTATVPFLSEVSVPKPIPSPLDDISHEDIVGNCSRNVVTHQTTERCCGRTFEL